MARTYTFFVFICRIAKPILYVNITLKFKSIHYFLICNCCQLFHVDRWRFKFLTTVIYCCLDLSSLRAASLRRYLVWDSGSPIVESCPCQTLTIYIEHDLEES